MRCYLLSLSLLVAPLWFGCSDNLQSPSSTAPSASGSAAATGMGGNGTFNGQNGGTNAGVTGGTGNSNLSGGGANPASGGATQPGVAGQQSGAGAADQVAGGGGANGTAPNNMGGDSATAGVANQSGTGGDGSAGGAPETDLGPSPRSRVSFNDGWLFKKDDPQGTSGLAYSQAKSWLLPTGNAFVKDAASRAAMPDGNLADGVAYIAPDFDDSSWQGITLPHDYAIEGPYTDSISSSMGRLPSIGVAWYRKTFDLPAEADGKSIFLDIDGAMSYSMVWANGEFVGGWPYGYASYRVDLTEHLKPGEENVVAIRLDNPVPKDAQWDSGSSRWYPGAGIYRNVWLVSAQPVHVSQWGTNLTTPDVTDTSATVDLTVSVDNDSSADVSVSIETDIYELDPMGRRVGDPVTSLAPSQLMIPAGEFANVDTMGSIEQPKLWGVPPTQAPNRYQAVTYVRQDDMLLDRYETSFGVRTIEFDPDNGFFLNGEHVKMNGVCMHHDLGPLGAAVNFRGRERQLELMAEMGSNAIRTSHNPPEPEFLELADRMGFLIMDESFDVWVQGKVALDYHLLFPEWHERDLRALIRRDRNHPSVVMWSVGNEIVEQSDNTAGRNLAQELVDIAHEEDPTRPTVAGMNSAKPDSGFVQPIDSVGLNYQGTGVRSGPAQYPVFHSQLPGKFIVGTETTSTFSSRGIYLFPVASGRGETANGSSGIDTSKGYVSSYDLYYADWSYSPDAEFESQQRYPFVGGEFVWTGIDYLGEPTPLDSVASSSYFGIVDRAGLKKDRFYLYQANWRPDLPMAHILPHWTWPGREGQVTPVHVYTSGDSAELFLNGTSLGKKSKGEYDYRLRWDDVQYEAGELKVVAYKDGQEWATDTVQTAGSATQLQLTPDKAVITANGTDLSFVTLTVTDADGLLVPSAMNDVHFELSGAGEIVATDNGDSTNRTPYPAADRKAFSGMAVAVIRALPGQPGELTLTATAQGLTSGSAVVQAQ